MKGGQDLNNIILRLTAKLMAITMITTAVAATAPTYVYASNHCGSGHHSESQKHHEESQQHHEESQQHHEESQQHHEESHNVEQCNTNSFECSTYECNENTLLCNNVGNNNQLSKNCSKGFSVIPYDDNYFFLVCDGKCWCASYKDGSLVPWNFN